MNYYPLHYYIDCGTLVAGDDEGTIWMYDLKKLLSKAKTDADVEDTKKNLEIVEPKVRQVFFFFLFIKYYCFFVVVGVFYIFVCSIYTQWPCSLQSFSFIFPTVLFLFLLNITLCFPSKSDPLFQTSTFPFKSHSSY